MQRLATLSETGQAERAAVGEVEAVVCGWGGVEVPGEEGEGLEGGGEEVHLEWCGFAIVDMWGGVGRRCCDGRFVNFVAAVNWLSEWG